MLTPRRLYLYVVAAASLAMLVTGLAQAGAATLELLLGGSALASTYRQTIATAGAAIIVGLPLWLLHWTLAQRLAGRDQAERSATLRRLFLYGVLSALLVAIGALAYQVVNTALVLAIGPERTTDGATTIGLLRSAWELAVVTAFWVYTFRVAAADRTAVAEVGGSATLRRWYTYGAQLVALIIALSGAVALLDAILLNLFVRPAAISGHLDVAGDIAATVVGLGIWLFHRRWTASGALAGADRQTTLRALHGFVIVAIAVGVTLTSVSQCLYWSLARILGVSRPGGMPGDPLGALHGTVATAIVFGAAWALMRRNLARDATGMEAERQSGVRRLYQYLVALVALGTFATGATLLLWTLVDRLVGRDVASSSTDLRDQVSLSVTLLLVGLPVWLLHWRPVPPAGERLALSRRLYVFTSLLASVLAGLGSGVWLASQVLNQLLAVGSARPALEIGHALGLLLVALAIGVYHARVLREDNASRTALRRTAAQVAPDEAPGTTEPPAILVEIAGATEVQVRTALGALPEGATYQFRER